jgi:hypothetical protein
MPARAFIVIEADGDDAIDQILQLSLAMPRDEQFQRTGDVVRATIPLAPEFFAKFLERDLAGYYFNDGPDCYVCGRPNERKPRAIAPIEYETGYGFNHDHGQQ